ncbi:MAG: hypothetical protein M3Z02_09685 [Actinomycetota bacterium]|nr:hypothetical protein [Actinomycetota bacterium]
MDERVAPTGGAGRPWSSGRTELALARLGDVETTPLTGHVELYDEVHRLLQDALAGLDDS